MVMEDATAVHPVPMVTTDPTELAKMPRCLRLTSRDISVKSEDLNWKERKPFLEGLRAMENGELSEWARRIDDVFNAPKSVVPFEKNQVHLKTSEGKSGYSNASRIQLTQTSGEEKFRL
ncbi:hypothetical protein BCR34DRAFT_667542 [Clohesyomyces aquaticus]|uniref:Uncharacterized protein n=1 Tax=Clohesyomyces aquaticus TaxID=1231657 RepID=A0A1Y1YYP6_9PLEO|nr:hypothetical protein BCR34DRAFT_667542 [Clohesyomyces aquaticus]